MSNCHPTISVKFFLPVDRFPQTIPNQFNTYHEDFQDDIYAWTIQTYVQLKNSGFPCELVGEMPPAGLVVAHRDCLKPDNYLSPDPNIFFVCIQSTRERLAYAQIHVVHNPLLAQQILSTHDLDVHYIEAWPTPGLRPRDPDRGNRLENIAYLGHLEDLAPELKRYGFHQQLQALGLTWHVLPHNPGDYTNIDGIVAVRHLQTEVMRQTDHFIHHSGQKLCDAWLADVPIITGPESAYQALGTNHDNYCEVNHADEIVQQLKQLRDNPEQYRERIENGRTKAQSINRQALTHQWQQFLEHVAIPSYQKWCLLSESDRVAALATNRSMVDQRNRTVVLKQTELQTLKANDLPYDLSEKA